MDYVGSMIRPPSEADSILLQATLGCSHNKCAFCGAYTGKRFGIKPEETIFQDIEFAARYCRAQRRLFLCDGDALIMPMNRLVPILKRIRERLPWVARVGSYANAKSLARKSDADLAELRDLGLSMLYMGLESGDNAILADMNKHGDADLIIGQGRRAVEAGYKLSVTVLLGLGGRELSLRHAEATGRALTRMDPHQAAALTLMLVPGTPLHHRAAAGRFHLPDARGMLAELGTMIEHTDLSRGLFLANHASNYLPVRARMPRDKAATLARIREALDGRVRLVPEASRRL